MTPDHRKISWFSVVAFGLAGNESLMMLGAIYSIQPAAALYCMFAVFILSAIAAYGWCKLVARKPERVGGIATACIDAYAEYNPVIPVLAGTTYWFSWVVASAMSALFCASAIQQLAMNHLPMHLTASIILLLAAGISLLPLRFSAKFAVSLFLLAIVTLILSIISPLIGGAFHWQQIQAFSLVTRFPGLFGQTSALMSSWYILFWSIPAFEVIFCLSGLMREPSKNLPRALITSICISALCFIIIPFVWQGTLGVDVLSSDYVLMSGWHGFVSLFTPIMSVSNATICLLVLILSNMFLVVLGGIVCSSRVMQQLAEEKLIPNFFASSDKSKAPAMTILLMAILGLIFIWYGTPVWLMAATNIGYLSCLIISSIAIYLLRHEVQYTKTEMRLIKAGVVVSFIIIITTVFGLQLYGLVAILNGLAFVLAGASLLFIRKLLDGNHLGNLLHSLYFKIAGPIFLVLAVDASGYLIAVYALPDDFLLLKTILEDIFTLIAILTIVVGLVLPGVLARTAEKVTQTAQSLMNGVVTDFVNAMKALSLGKLDEASVSINVEPIKVTSNDEFGVMLRTFNLLQAKIKDAAYSLIVARDQMRKTRDELTASEETNQNLLGIVSDAVMKIDSRGHILSANPAALQLFELDEKTVDATPITALIPIWSDKLISDVNHNHETYGRTKTGKRINIEWNASLTSTDNVDSYLLTLKDITARKEAEKMLVMREKVIAASTNGVVIIDMKSQQAIIYVNDALVQMTGFQSDEILGHPIQFLFQANPPNPKYDVLAVFESHADNIIEVQSNKKNGEMAWYEIHFSPIKEKNEILYMVGIVIDITNRKKMEDDLKRLALFDSLTAIPNRFLLSDRLVQAVTNAKSTRSLLAVLFLDIDRFKFINDTYGHPIGDDLLVVIVERLLKCVKPTDTVARFGGDEFVIVLENYHTIDHVNVIAADIAHQLRQPISLSIGELAITISIGISIYPQDGDDASTLIKNADAAMYMAKSSGRNQIAYYEIELNDLSKRLLLLENDLHHALANNEFTLLFQPVFDVKNNVINSAEALIRWHHPQLGVISPVEFIKIAEDTHMVNEIGDWVIKTAFKQQRMWQDQGMQPIYIAINLSINQLKASDFISNVKTHLTTYAINPDHIEFELTESMMMDNSPELAASLNALKAMGFDLAMDDFGTGYSCLTNLRRFDFDKLKIDQAFTKTMLSNNDDKEIVLAIIAMAKKLNLRITAEGIETQEQYAFLKANEVDKLQGYYYGKPMPAIEFEELLIQYI